MRASTHSSSPVAIGSHASISRRQLSGAVEEAGAVAISRCINVPSCTGFGISAASAQSSDSMRWSRTVRIMSGHIRRAVDARCGDSSVIAASATRSQCNSWGSARDAVACLIKVWSSPALASWSKADRGREGLTGTQPDSGAHVIAAQHRPRSAGRLPPGGNMTLARITVHPDYVVAPVPARLFGSFVEHMGRCVYTGIYEPGHPTADEDGFRGRPDLSPSWGHPGAVPRRELRLRLPVGGRRRPVARRPTRLDLAWRSIESNEFGLNEFMRWAREAGSRP